MFELNLRERNISKEKLLADLKNVAESLDKETVTAVLYSQKGKIGVNTFLRRFGSAKGEDILSKIKRAKEALAKQCLEHH